MTAAAVAFGLICGGTDAPGPNASPERRLSAGTVPRIAYSADGDLWVVEPGGHGRRRLTTPDWVEFDPSLSPQG